MECMGLSVPIPQESGISECARLSSAPICNDLNHGLAMLVFGVPALAVWIMMAAWAMVDITKVRRDHRTRWLLLLVSCLPVVGACAWFIYRTTQKLRSSQGDLAKSDNSE
ncbi:MULTISPECIES: PLD nuclease N-terminal domain-containing protein [Mycobacterium ulcerans group]|uniref:Uncharacterized protein n=2 Tax=Mycobacterium ulcerans group TaxID=2993898 RepID=B6CLS2_MYCMR|nr:MULTISPECIES: PLD nuclease N-terminal domain-containing protein [Mycobacterium ulcerans group]ACA50996.1 conserved hypothetical protein [Mycobacterium marinum DL240490]GAQ32855.1 hypothetical protein MPS_1235 [Mycobacterium pseudoshottsii JCM 15466]